MDPKTHIRVRCQCGAVLMAPAQLAGRTASCGSCGEEIEIPEPITVEEQTVGFRPESSRSKSRVYKQARRDTETEDVTRKELQTRRKRRTKASRSAVPSRLKSKTWWLKSLQFPFRTESLITIGVLSFLYGTLVSGVSGFWLFLLIGSAGRILASLVIGYFIYFLLDVLRTAAHGQEDLPVATEWSTENILTDLFLALGVIALCYLPWGGYRLYSFWNDRELNIVVDGLLLWLPTLYFPMALLSATIHHSFLAVNPVTVMRAMALTWLDYVIVLGLIAVGYGLSWSVSYLMAGGLLAGIAGWWGTFTGMTMAMHALGSLYLRNRSRLAWIAE